MLMLVMKKKKIIGTLPYLEPEFYKDNKYSKESDVYSFVMIMYRIFVRFSPYKLSSPMTIMTQVLKNKRPGINIKTPASIKKTH